MKRVASTPPCRGCRQRRCQCVRTNISDSVDVWLARVLIKPALLPHRSSILMHKLGRYLRSTKRAGCEVVGNSVQITTDKINNDTIRLRRFVVL
jgi:hypothetical protein